MTRLPYETTGGQVSESATFEQLTEYLRLAEEACYTIGHLRKANGGMADGEGFLQVGQRLANMRELIISIATGAVKGRS